jgi:SnoaL-like domain
MSDQDESAIIRVINRYGITMDARRWDLFDTIFTSDVELTYPGGAHWRDLASFKRDFAAAHEPFDATQHAMLNHLVDIDGDRATSFTYCFFRLIKRGTEGGDFLEGSAWYDDAWVRMAPGWRIKRRVCRILWTDGNPRATGAGQHLPWDLLRVEAAEGKVGYLKAIDRRRQ